ncbi:MAG: polysialyltransferase family glycosyltransferase [Lachnospiraceae bacterium]|nr:polysialyltransferase family glycosyltransferase [Lachnospiraceae bacterium]
MENHNDVNKTILEKCDISKLGNIDFVAIAISGWHFSVIFSYLISLKKVLRGVIYVNQSRIGEEMLVYSETINISYVNIASLKYNKNVENIKELLYGRNKNEGKDLRILTPFGYNLSLFTEIRKNFKDRNTNLVRFDEGIGTYLTEKDFNLFASELSNKKKFNQLKINIKLIIKKFLINRLKSNGFHFESFFLFKKTDKSLIANEDAVKNFREFYHAYAKYSLDYQTEQILVFKDYDIDRIQTHDIIEFYKQLINTLSTKGKKIYIKKHPYDNEPLFDHAMSAYENVYIVKNSLDAEMLYSCLNPIITVGGVSTCCFSIPIIFNKVVYNFSELYEKYSIAPILEKEILLRKLYFPNDDRIVFIDSFNSII